MQPSLKTLFVEQLLAGGFNRCGQWGLSNGQLGLSERPPEQPGVYAFCLAGTCQYVGLASKSLARRLYGYERPGPTQRTNLRLNELLGERTQEGATVQLLVACPPDLVWNGWSICGAEGLEAALIRDYDLPWNVRGSTAVHSATGVRPQSTATRAQPETRARKYDPLRNYLENNGKESVSMTFGQIEDLVGRLPKSASLHQAWWGNHEGNTQAKAWMGARYLVEANPTGRSVIFRKFRF